MDIARVCSSSDSGIVTNQDWMIGALLALNKPTTATIENQKAIATDCAMEDSKVAQPTKENESKKEEALPTGDSSNVAGQSSGPKTDAESVPEAIP